MFSFDTEKAVAVVSACCMTPGLACFAGGDAGSATTAPVKERPNVLWLTSEDNNVTWIGCYGNKESRTPTLDKLAKEGFQYTNAFAVAPVCAPSRSSWITGMYAVSMGTQNMRSRYPIPHDEIKYYPDILRANGYYCANYPKTDYNIGGRNDKACWDNPDPVDWQALKEHQPFFQVINCGMSHESQAKYKNDKTRHSPDDVTLRKYHPDDVIIKKNYARYYDCVENMDAFEAKQLAALEKAGLSDNTIVIYCSDHGGVLPRSKRFLFDSGLHSPLIIRIPEKFKRLWPASNPGTKIDRLVSFVDMPKTWLSVCGCEPPGYMQGRIFLGPKAEPEPEYAFAFRGRMDERVDNQRAVRGKRFLYVKNYMPYVPWGQKLEYMWEMPAYQAWERLFKEGKTNAVTGRFFRVKNGDELYDTLKDPDNVKNLVDNPEYHDVMLKMRLAVRKWQERIHDAGLMPESEAIRRADANHTTIYAMARNPKLYDLRGYLDLSDMALEKNPENLDVFGNALGDKDLVKRYWGLVGCLLVKDSLSVAVKKRIAGLFDDESHAVRAMSAFVSIRAGFEKDAALDVLRGLLKRKSYAMLEVLNIVDWLGDDAKPLLDTVSSVESNDMNVRKVCRCVLGKFGIATPENLKKRPPPWKKKKKKKVVSKKG